MIGLLIKDLMALRRQLRILGVLLAFYIVFGLLTRNVTMLGAMMTMLLSMMPITTLAYDEQCKWEPYALSMPLSRKTLVAEKYLLGFALVLSALVVVIPASLIMDALLKSPDESPLLLTLSIVLFGGLFIMAVSLPAAFRFGVEKGRYIMLAAVVVPGILLVLIPQMLADSGVDLEGTIRGLAVILPILAPLVALLLFGFSLLLSIRIVAKKEF